VVEEAIACAGLQSQRERERERYGTVLFIIYALDFALDVGV
jgi:hypothetical protein